MSILMPTATTIGRAVVKLMDVTWDRCSAEADEDIKAVYDQLEKMDIDQAPRRELLAIADILLDIQAQYGVSHEEEREVALV